VKRGFRSRETPLIDIGQSSLKVLLGERGVELSIERTASGELTPASRESVRRELSVFLGTRRQPLLALCALPARGVSLRSISVPPAPRDETQRLLAFQLEKEFPLPAAELAWGYSLFASNGAAPRGQAGPQAGAIAALRRQALEQYAGLFGECGLRPVFNLGALSASALCPLPPGRSFVLDIGRTHSELLDLRDGLPESVRTLPWGGAEVTRAIQKALGVDDAGAEELKRSWKGTLAAPKPSPAGLEHALPAAQLLHIAIADSVKPLVRLLQDEVRGAGEDGNGSRPPCHVFLLGGGSRLQGLPEELARGLGAGVSLELAEPAASGVAGPGRSAVTLGLLREAGSAGGSLRFECGAKLAEAGPAERKGSFGLWLGVALLLGAISIALRYAPAFLLAAELEDRVAGARERLERLPRLDGELRFLEELERSHPPYLEALAALATAAPRGTVLAELSMNRQGEVSFSGSTGTFLEANDLRGKLAASGWFSQAVLEEQIPTKDKKRIEFRLRARLRSAGSPPPPLAAPPAPEPKSKPPATPDPAETPAAPQEPPPPAAEAPPQALQPELQPPADAGEKAR
jgi:Tfp pilus assembly PilM family ATPase/Tfp pilus assembly protein PilN